VRWEMLFSRHLQKKQPQDCFWTSGHVDVDLLESEKKIFLNFIEENKSLTPGGGFNEI